MTGDLALPLPTPVPNAAAGGVGPGGSAGTGPRTVRVLSVIVGEADQWFADARRQSRWSAYGKRPDRSRGSVADQCRQAALTAMHLGVPVGVVVRVREETADAS
ncbi:MAG TPA: hypothetical protein VIV12_20380 [Streptosporangiaceae bacterium]